MSTSQAGSGAADQIAQLQEAVESLTRRLAVVEAANQIRSLHHQYGYYLDKCLYEEVVDLFSSDGEVVFLGGTYRGRTGIERLYIDRFQNRFTEGRNGPVPGFLLDHVMMQDVITVADDAQSAQGRFRCLMQAGRHQSHPELGSGSFQQWWEGGLYENTYVVEDGIWKIQRLDYRAFWHGDFDKGWARTEPLSFMIPTKTVAEDPMGPDEIDPEFALFPATDVVPFHYPHPVTGASWEPTP